ncbi:MAG: hypothetical protein J3K34DRAFT_73460 [Monoraphidium minutum]|nr:MAG: hypothetical protein J3K34DRAFT_73460 [Monoraphidium minutum]
MHGRTHTRALTHMRTQRWPALGRTAGRASRLRALGGTLAMRAALAGRQRSTTRMLVPCAGKFAGPAKPTPARGAPVRLCSLSGRFVSGSSVPLLGSSAPRNVKSATHPICPMPGKSQAPPRPRPPRPLAAPRSLVMPEGQGPPPPAAQWPGPALPPRALARVFPYLPRVPHQQHPV